jgi:predicted glycosyltransferase
VADSGANVILVPRDQGQAARYQSPAVTVPAKAVDGMSLLAAADVVVGAGGTMNREAALLGTPTYTVFSGKLAAVDAALIQQGSMVDLRRSGTLPRVEKKQRASLNGAPERGKRILDLVIQVTEEVAQRGNTP